MSIPFVDLKTQYQSMKSEIDAAISEVVETCMFVQGPAVQKCEAELSEFLNVKHSVSCSSGTDAIVIALMALNIGPGDEVIVPGFSFIATAEAVSLTGATPVFVDIEDVGFNIDTNLLEAAITPKTKAIMPVSLYGQTSNMNEINVLAQKHSLPVIEDAAQSFGAKYDGKMSGAVSTIGTTSFFPAKPLGCYGDGGAIFTNDDEIAKSMREVANHGQTERYVHGRLGMNGRMDAIQCAVVSVKLKHFEKEIAKRQKLAADYTAAFQGVDGVMTPVVLENRTSVWAQYTLRVENRDGLQAHLKEKNVPSAVHYPIPMYRQKVYDNLSAGLKLPVCEMLAEKVISLPMHPYMTDDQVQYIAESVKSFY